MTTTIPDYTREPDAPIDELARPDVLGPILTRYLADFADEAIVAQSHDSANCLIARAIQAAGFPGSVVRQQSILVRVADDTIANLAHSPFSRSVMAAIDWRAEPTPITRAEALADVRELLVRAAIGEVAE